MKNHTLKTIFIWGNVYVNTNMCANQAI
jgi:hypothetical protein